MGLVDEMSQGNFMQRMWGDMVAAIGGGGASPTNISIGDIVVPPGMTPEQAQQIVSQGVQDGISRSELRRAHHALQSPVAQ